MAPERLQQPAPSRLDANRGTGRSGTDARLRRHERRASTRRELVAPTGFEPVFERGHVFAKRFGKLRCKGVQKTRRD